MERVLFKNWFLIRHLKILSKLLLFFASLQAERERLNGIDSITWKQMFIDWSNEFETIHSDTDWDKNDYLEEIEKYAKRKILGYADIIRK